MNQIKEFSALVLEGKKKISLRKIILPSKLKKNQVLVKIYYSGICGKQIEEYIHQKGKDVFVPHLLGHEASGKIVKVGPGVNTFEVGDLVVLHWMKNPKIKDCETPEYSYAKTKKKINSGRITTFSEYSIISSNRLTKISKKIDLRLAAMMGCCLSTGLGTIFNQSNIKKMDKALIVGCGGVGLSILIGLNLKKQKNIAVADINKINLKKAKKFGASVLINLKKDKISDFKKYDFNKIFITTGSKSGIENAIKLAATKSDIYFVGVSAPNDFVKIKPFQIHIGMKLHPSVGGSIYPKKDIPKYIGKLSSDKNLLKNYINHIVNLKKAPKIINLMSKGMLSNGRNLIKIG